MGPKTDRYHWSGISVLTLGTSAMPCFDSWQRPPTLYTEYTRKVWFTHNIYEVAFKQPQTQTLSPSTLTRYLIAKDWQLHTFSSIWQRWQQRDTNQPLRRVRARIYAAFSVFFLITIQSVREVNNINVKGWRREARNGNDYGQPVFPSTFYDRSSGCEIAPQTRSDF